MGFNDMKLLKQVIKAAALNMPLDAFSVQGFGMMRLRLSDNLRLHLWHHGFRTDGVSDIHDHRQWGLRSTVLAGHIRDNIFGIGDGRPNYDAVQIKAGEDAREISRQPVELLYLDEQRYQAGDTYEHRPNDIHRTGYDNFTFTLMEQFRDPLNKDGAFVFVPRGGMWVDAKPRPANGYELEFFIKAVRERL